jgi:flavodoxin long chain
MNKIGLFYGSSTSHTESVAYDLQETLNKVEANLVTIHNIGEATPEQLNAYPYLIFGIPTWDIGELQEDWEFFWDKLESVDFAHKKVAIFGLGDQYGYPDTFLDAVGILGEEVLALGGELVGFWSPEGYEFEDSLALTSGGKLLVGLALDEDNQGDMTLQRIQQWSNQILAEFGLLEKASA